MNDLIEALTILLKYANDDRYPIHCEHDTLYIGCDITLDKVCEEDVKRLEDLGILWSESGDRFISYRFGSC